VWNNTQTEPCAPSFYVGAERSPLPGDILARARRRGCSLGRTGLHPRSGPPRSRRRLPARRRQSPASAPGLGRKILRTPRPDRRTRRNPSHTHQGFCLLPRQATGTARHPGRYDLAPSRHPTPHARGTCRKPSPSLRRSRKRLPGHPQLADPPRPGLTAHRGTDRMGIRQHPRLRDRRRQLRPARRPRRGPHSNQRPQTGFLGPHPSGPGTHARRRARTWHLRPQRNPRHRPAASPQRLHQRRHPDPRSRPRTRSTTPDAPPGVIL